MREPGPARSATNLGRAALRLATGRAGRGGAVVMCYHDVVARAPAPLALDVTAAQLSRQLRLTQRLGFEFVTLGDLVDRLLRGLDVGGLAAVTFDDALVGVSRHAMPVLEELDVPATLLAVSSVWGRRPDWWVGAGRTMSQEELLEAHRAGLSVAAHTRTHPSLPELDAAALGDEVAGSRRELEDLVQTDIDLFAYPFGHHGPEVRESVREAGYRAAFTFLNGRIVGDEDRWRLPRLTMGRHHDPARLAYHLGRAPSTWPAHQLDLVTGEE